MSNAVICVTNLSVVSTHKQPLIFYNDTDDCQCHQCQQDNVSNIKSLQCYECVRIGEEKIKCILITLFNKHSLNTYWNCCSSLGTLKWSICQQGTLERGWRPGRGELWLSSLLVLLSSQAWHFTLVAVLSLFFSSFLESVSWRSLGVTKGSQAVSSFQKSESQFCGALCQASSFW